MQTRQKGVTQTQSLNDTVQKVSELKETLVLLQQLGISLRTSGLNKVVDPFATFWSTSLQPFRCQIQVKIDHINDKNQEKDCDPYHLERDPSEQAEKRSLDASITIS